jgi:tripartite motif-containing protein 2/3
MWNPCDIAFLPDEMAVVAEYDNVTDRNNKLQIFDRAGKSLQIIAQGVIQPLGVALTLNGHLAVTDCKGKRVKLLTVGGQSVLDIGKGQFGWPYGIAVNSRGQIIVTDAFNDTVSIYTIDGRRIKTFGSSGSQSSQFLNPYHVTIDSRDNIIVSDCGNNCVKIFDASSCKFIYKVDDSMRRTPSQDLILSTSKISKPKGRTLKAPRGVTVDLSGNILVADDCGRICMFDSEGVYVRNLLTEDDFVKYPEAVHCSRRGFLAVTEWSANNMCAVKMFNMYE